MYLMAAFVFALLSMIMALAAAVFAAFWAISNISYFGIAGDYATFGLLAAVAGTATSLIAMIVTALAIFPKSASKTFPTLGLIFVIVTFVIAVTTAALSPFWMTADIVKYGIVSTMPLAGPTLGVMVGSMSLVALVMFVVDRVIKPGAGSA
jgi:hypothetical protein